MKKLCIMTIVFLVLSMVGCSQQAMPSENSKPENFKDKIQWYDITASKDSYQIDRTYDCVSPATLRFAIEKNGGRASTIKEMGWGKYAVCFNHNNTMVYSTMTLNEDNTWVLDEITSKEYIYLVAGADTPTLSDEKKLTLEATMKALLTTPDDQLEMLFSGLSKKPQTVGIQFYGSDYFSVAFDNTDTRERLIVFFDLDNLNIKYFNYYHVLK